MLHDGVLDSSDDIADEPRAEAAPRRRGRAHRAAVDRSERVFGVSNGRIAGETFGIVAIASLLATYLYRLWDAPLHLPVTSINGDQNQTLMTVKSIIQTGWILSQPRLGAPFGQVNHDFPQGGETAQFLIIKLLAQFTSSPGLIVNIYYLAGFGLVAAVTHLVLRHLRFGMLISAALALPFAYLPYRVVYHAEEHLTRANYITVPLACLLLVWLAGWRSRFLREPAALRWRSNLRWPRVAAALAICVLIGSWESMVAIFSLVLLSAGAVIGGIRWRDWRRLLVGLAGCATIGLSFVLVSLPTLLYWRAHGKNPVAGRRIVAEAEMYGLKLNRVLLPSDGSRFHFLKVFGKHSQLQSPVPSEGGQSLGILFALGLIGVLFAAVAGARLRRPESGFDLRAAEDRGLLAEVTGPAAVVTILVAEVGGMATVLSMAGLAQVRTWNRIVLFLAFFAALQLAVWFEASARWLAPRLPRPRPVLAVAAVLVCVLALVDGPPVMRSRYFAIVAQWRSDRAMVASIEQVMPPGTAVMEVPYVKYPETYPPGRMVDYDPVRPFLADEAGTLRWSYGGLAGRPQADWQQGLLTGHQIVAGLPGLLGMGFTGLWVDTYGFPADPTIDAQLRSVLKVAPLVSPDRRFLFYDLRPYRAALGLTDAQLRRRAISTFGIAPPG